MDNYISPTIESASDSGDATTMGVVGITLAVLLAAVVYNGAVLVNYIAGINVGGGVNVAGIVLAVVATPE